MQALDRPEAGRHRRAGRRAGRSTRSTGKPTKKKIGTGSTTITKDNLAENQDALYKPSC